MERYLVRALGTVDLVVEEGSHPAPRNIGLSAGGEATVRRVLSVIPPGLTGPLEAIPHPAVVGERAGVAGLLELVRLE